MVSSRRALKPPTRIPTPTQPGRRCRLDSLVGLFAAGCAPTATADPYGLRRSAVGLLQALLGAEARLDLGAAVAAAAAVQPLAVTPEAQAAVLEFVERRLEQLLVDGGEQVRVPWHEGTCQPVFCSLPRSALPPRCPSLLLLLLLQIEAVRAALRERGHDATLAARTAREIRVRAARSLGGRGRRGVGMSTLQAG